MLVLDLPSRGLLVAGLDMGCMAVAVPLRTLWRLAGHMTGW